MLNESQNYLTRLVAADRAHQQESAAGFLLRGVKYVCALVLFAFVLDVIVHLDSGWRFAILLAMIVGALGLAAYGGYLAFVRKNRIEHTARFLESRDPALGSRLINLLQLSAQASDQTLPPLTRELARQAVEIYSSELRDVPLERLARTDKLGRHLKLATWALLIFAAVLGIGFRISALEAARFADPFGDHPAYSFTRLEIVQPGPAGTNVLYDKGVVVRVKAGGHQPKELFLTAFPLGHREKAITLPMFEKSGSGYDQLIDNIRGETVVFAHTKDHSSESRQARIGVMLTPQLENVFVQITPPAYTGIRAEEKPYAFKDLQALEGSEIRFRLQSNRPLREGILEVDAGDAPPQLVPLKKSAEREVAGSFIAKDSGRTRLSIVDVAGLPSQGDHDGALTVTHDLPPEVHLANPERDCFVAMDFKLEAQIEASDDYGLREVRLHRGLNGVFSAPKVFLFTNIVRDCRETVDFRFGELGVQPGDIVSLFAEAIDNSPQPHLARSQTVRVSIISVDDYNNFVREQHDMEDAEAKYADLNADLQSLIDAQKQLGEEIQALSRQVAGADAKKREELARQLDRLVAEQNEMNQKLRQHADRMENFVRDNPVYDVETNLQQMLRQQAVDIRSSVRANDSATREVAQQSSPPHGARQLNSEMLAALKKASDDQLARLGASHAETEKDIVQTLDNMSQMQELQKDFNLFEALFHEQQDLAAQAAAYNRSEQLPREDQLALKDLASREKDVSDALGKLQDKLGDDAKAAQTLFPKAAQSARDLAKEMNDRRLQPLANQATSHMLAASGEQSFQLAERLRGEMEKMFSQCQGGNCPSSNELDSYLKLRRMSPNNTFAQMGRSRKLGFGTGREGASGAGEGSAGSKGVAMTDGSALAVLGNEASPRSGSKASRQSDRFGRGAGALAAADQGGTEKPDTMKSLNPVNRRSAAVSSEAMLDEYNDVVENYFKAITTKKGKPSDATQN